MDRRFSAFEALTVRVVAVTAVTCISSSSICSLSGVKVRYMQETQTSITKERLSRKETGFLNIERRGQEMLLMCLQGLGGFLTKTCLLIRKL